MIKQNTVYKQFVVLSLTLTICQMQDYQNHLHAPQIHQTDFLSLPFYKVFSDYHAAMSQDKLVMNVSPFVNLT